MRRTTGLIYSRRPFQQMVGYFIMKRNSGKEGPEAEKFNTLLGILKILEIYSSCRFLSSLGKTCKRDDLQDFSIFFEES